MKYLLLALLALTACGKSSETKDPNTVTVEVFVVKDQHPGVPDVDYWRPGVNFSKPVTTTGSVLITWQEYADGLFISDKVAQLNMSITNATTFAITTGHLVPSNYIAKNIKLVDVDLTGGPYEY